MSEHLGGRFSLRQLEQFVTLGEELHFGRAAARLGMHQAPLSQAIQKLEVELGVQLFERTHRHVVLTPAGADLLRHARTLVEDAKSFSRRALRLAGGVQGTLTVGFVSTAVYGYLPDLLRVFRDRYPDVALRLREATTDVQLELLLHGEIDVGLVIDSPTSAILGIQRHPVRTDRLIVALPASWEMERFTDGMAGNIDLRLLAREELITIPRQIGPALFEAIVSCFAKHDIVPRRGQEGIQMQTILGLVAAGLGYAVVPESMRSLARSDVHYFDIAGDVPNVVLSMAWRLRDPNPVLGNFVQIASALQKDDVDVKRVPRPMGRSRIDRRSGPTGSSSTKR